MGFRREITANPCRSSVLARNFEDGVYSELYNNEKEATASEANRIKEKKEETVLGMKSIQTWAGKGRVPYVGKGIETS